MNFRITYGIKKKNIMNYINAFKKSKKLSNLKKSEEWDNLCFALDRNGFINKVNNAILQHNYTGNIYKFTFSLVVPNQSISDSNRDFFKLPFKDMSNLLSLFIFQRFTKILGIGVIFFSLTNIKYKKHKLYFTYQGYFSTSVWYNETEKTKIITSIYSILSHQKTLGMLFFDDIKFNFKLINIKNFKKNFEKYSNNWKVDFIYLFYLSSPIYNYELDAYDNSLDSALNFDLYHFNTIHWSDFFIISKPFSIESWDNFLSSYLIEYNFIKTSPLILFILNELHYTPDQLKKINFLHELEKIYIKLFTRIKSNNCLLNIKDYKSQYFLKMYYIYFVKNDLCIAWNGIYKFNPVTSQLNYYCNFYKMYKNKNDIQKYINEIYNFYYIDEKYKYFSLLDFLKCKKKLPQKNFYTSLGLVSNPLKNIKSLFLKCINKLIVFRVL